MPFYRTSQRHLKAGLVFHRPRSQERLENPKMGTMTAKSLAHPPIGPVPWMPTNCPAELVKHFITQAAKKNLHGDYRDIVTAWALMGLGCQR
jgi:hypothetical protein